jgi:putative membrane protein
MNMIATSAPLELKCLSFVWLAGLLISRWMPFDRTTWLLEVFPAFIALAMMWGSWTRLELTLLLYCLIGLHGLILMVGGTFSYARVPLGFWMQDWFGFARNNYDKICHFTQGFVPAIVARELLIRVFRLTSRRLVTFLCIAICLAVSASYELLEWGSALWLGQGADAFLGTQGDPWDTQSDMFFALMGSILGLALLSGLHDLQLARMISQQGVQSTSV